MIGRRSTTGLALLSAFAFCAFAAQSATAQVGDPSVNTTAVTCAFLGSNEDFEDGPCDEKVPDGTGPFGHEPIANDTTTEIEVEATEPSVLKGTLASVATEVSCTTVSSVNDKSFLHNVETSGKHTVTGTAHVEFTGCTVLKPSKCTIKAPITFTSNFVGVEGLGPNNDTMGVEFVGTGAGKTVAELTFANKGAEKCALLNGGKAFVCKGSMIATSTVDQPNPHSGATWVFEDQNEMETLEIGLKKASLTGEFTTTMADGGNELAPFGACEHHGKLT